MLGNVCFSNRPSGVKHVRLSTTAVSIVGIEKRELMRVQFTAADIAQQIRVKTAFDPDWLLNPAKVFPLEGRGMTVHCASASGPIPG